MENKPDHMKNTSIIQCEMFQEKKFIKLEHNEVISDSLWILT